MPKKTLFLVVGLITLTAFLVFIAIKQERRGPSQQEQPTSQGPTPTAPAHTTLALTPNPVSVSGTATGTIEIVVDTQAFGGSNDITAVQLEIGYDPNALSNVTLAPGPFFPNPLELLKNINTQTGRVTYALAITPAQQPMKGKSATMTFTKSPGSNVSETSIELLPKSLVTAQGVSPSVLKSNTSTKVIFQ